MFILKIKFLSHKNQQSIYPKKREYDSQFGERLEKIN